MSADETTPPTAARSVRRWRGPRFLIVLGAGVLAFTGLSLWWGGVFDGSERWESLCEGHAFPEAETRQLLDGAEPTALSADERERALVGQEYDGCGVRGGGEPGPTVTISLESRLEGFAGPGLIPAPLGHGWNGALASDPEFEREDDRGGSSHRQQRAEVAIVFDCGSPAPRTVQVKAELDGAATFADPGKRTQLVAVATKMARTYHTNDSYEGKLGGRVTSIGSSTTPVDARPFAEATGACADLLSAGSTRGMGVRTVLESPEGKSPWEQCVLGGYRGTPL